MAVELVDPMGGSRDSVHMGLWRSPYAGQRSADMHRAFEVDLILCGRFDHSFEGHTASGQAGDVVLVAAWEPHSWCFAEAGTACLTIHFLPEFLAEDSVADMSWLSLFAEMPAARPRVMSARGRRRILEIAARLQEEMEETAPGWKDAVRMGLLETLLWLVRDWPARPAARARRTRYSPTELQRIMPALALVHADTAVRVQVDQAAEACRLSKRHFTTLFHRTMGMSFARFAVRARLREAAHLLRQTDLPIEIIAERTGFVDHSHLCRLFARTFGFSPGDFRKHVERPLSGVLQ